MLKSLSPNADEERSDERATKRDASPTLRGDSLFNGTVADAANLPATILAEAEIKKAIEDP